MAATERRVVILNGVGFVGATAGLGSYVIGDSEGAGPQQEQLSTFITMFCGLP